MPNMLRAFVLAGAAALAAFPLAGAATAAPTAHEHAASSPRAADITGSGVRFYADQQNGPGVQIGSVSQKDVITSVKCQDIVPYPGNNWYHVDVAGKGAGVLSAQFVTLRDQVPVCDAPAPTNPNV